MSDQKRIEMLIDLGFTQVEATVYYELLKDSPQSGYSIARQIGKSRSNVYQALKSLEQKGAIVQLQGSKNRIFQSVPIERMLEQKEREFTGHRKKVADAFSDLKQQEQVDSIYYMQNMEQVYAKANQIIDQTEKIIFIEVEKHHFEKIRQAVRRAIDRGVIVALYTSDIESFEGAEIIRHDRFMIENLIVEKWPVNWFSLAADANQFLITTTKLKSEEIKHSMYSGNRYLAGWIFSDMIYQIGFYDIITMFNEGRSREEIWSEIQKYVLKFVGHAPGLLELRDEYTKA